MSEQDTQGLPVLYSQPGCNACLALKGFLKRCGARFDEVDVTRDAQAIRVLRAAGVHSTPALGVDGVITAVKAQDIPRLGRSIASAQHAAARRLGQHEAGVGL